jgi:hypothetical protein
MKGGSKGRGAYFHVRSESGCVTDLGSWVAEHEHIEIIVECVAD